MGRTLSDVKKEADARFQAGGWILALQSYRKLLAWEPADIDTRFKVAHCLFELGERELARQIYHAVGLHCMKVGMPLRALVAARRVVRIDSHRTELYEAIAGLYSTDSERLRRGAPAKRRIPKLEREVADDSAAVLPPELLVPQVAKLAQTIKEPDAYPEQLPEIPLLSLLGADAIVSIAETVRERVMRHGQMILREGDKGDSFFILTDGAVRVFRQDGFGGEVNLANLGPGSVFGEMALVSATPRTASAQVHYEATLLEFNRESLRAVAEELEAVAVGLSKFCRDRLLRNMLATSPMFKPFNRRQRMEIIRRFTGHELSAGTVIIREGEEGRGLFLLLSGECDVSKIDGGERVLLATLHPGDPFGEMSLVRTQPTNATVVAAVDSTVLFLDRDLFTQLVEAVPEFRDYFEKLVEERELDTQLLMDSVEEEGYDLDEDDLILI